MQTFAFDVALRERDYLRFNILFFRQKMGFSLLFIFLAVVVYPLANFTFTWLYWLFHPEEPLALVWGNLVGPAAFLGIVTLFILLVRHQVRSDPKKRQTVHYSIGPDGIDLLADNWRAHHDWLNIARFEDIAGTLILYVNPNHALLLPKRCIEPADRPPLEALIADRVQVQGTPPRRWTGLRMFLIWITVFIVVLLLWNVFRQ